MAMLGNTAYVINSLGDSVSQLSLEPLESKAEVPVGDAPRGIATDNQCWVVVTNTGVDNPEGGRPSLSFLSADLSKSLTLSITAKEPGDPIVPTQVQVLVKEGAKEVWVLNIGARGEILIYPAPEAVQSCP